jgi:hypothetical protein
MTERFAWVDGLEMFSLILARDADSSELLDVLTDGRIVELTSADDWPADDHVKLVAGQDSGWAFALAFDSGLLPDDAVDRVGARWDAVSVWWDIKLNSGVRVYRSGELVRSCAVIGYGFESTTGEPLPEEADLFAEDEQRWDRRSDAVELVARLTGTAPVEAWWDDAVRAWATTARF